MEVFNNPIFISIVTATILPVVVKFAGECLNGVFSSLHFGKWAADLWKRLRGINTITLKTKHYAGKDINCGLSRENHTPELITAVMKHLLDSGATVNNVEYIRTTSCLNPCCINTVVHDNDTYEFYSYFEREDVMIVHEAQLIITTRKPIALVQRNLDLWYEKYCVSKDDDNRYIHFYVEYDSVVKWNRYTYNYSKKFDDVFFTQKASLMRDIDKLTDGTLDKICACLHGPPGTGKTSVIKAIAEYTKRHLFVINLKKVSSNENLMRAVFSENITFYDDGRHFSRVPMREKIIVFEDIDADDDVVLQRSEKDSTSQNTKVPFTVGGIDTITQHAKPETTLTLQGILTTLDGIVPIVGGIVIITTNHLNKLDKALVRPGRVTHDIYMGLISAVSAHEMIRHHFLDCDVDEKYDLVLQSMTPAELEVLCLASASIEDFLTALSEK